MSPATTSRLTPVGKTVLPSCHTTPWRRWKTTMRGTPPPSFSYSQDVARSGNRSGPWRRKRRLTGTGRLGRP